MKKVLFTLYKALPINLRNVLGSSTILKPIRSRILRADGVYKETEAFVRRDYSNYNISFNFFASFKIASKAEKHGIENTLLRNSIQLIKERGKTQDNAVVIDIGANFGYLSLVWSKTISKNGEIIAFEPNLNVFKSFSKSISSNNLKSKINLYNLAVGNEEKKIELFMNSTTSNTLEVNKSILKKTMIDMVSIDFFMKKINKQDCDLIKIDVDGIELDILNGAREFIDSCKPILIVETNENHEIIDFFKERSYRILDMALNEYNPNDKLPANIFCVPNS